MCRTAKGASLGWKAASGHKSAFEATARPPLMTTGDQPPPGAYETVCSWLVFQDLQQIHNLAWHQILPKALQC